MAVVLPTRDDLGRVNTPRPGGVASADLTGVGRGLASMGNSLAQAGAALKQGWEQANRSEVENRFQLFAFQERRQLDEMVQNTTPDQARGFTDTWSAGHKERVVAFLETVPDEYKAEYDTRTLQNYERMYVPTLTFERESQVLAVKNGFETRFQQVDIPQLMQDMAADDSTSDLELLAKKREAEARLREAVDALQLPPAEAEAYYQEKKAELQLYGAGAMSGARRTELNPADRGRSKFEAIRDAAAGFDVEFPVSEDSIVVAGDALNQAGLEASPRNLLLVHMLGPDDAVNLIGAAPGSPVGGILSKKTRDMWGDKLAGADGAMTAGDVFALADAQMDGVRAVEWGDEYDALLPAQKITLAADGAQALIKQDAARKKAEADAFNAQYDALYNGILDGTAGLSDINEAYGQGRGWLASDPEKRRALQTLWKQRNDEGLILNRALGKVQAATQGQYDPLGDPDRDGDAKALYGAVKKAAFAESQDPAPTLYTSGKADLTDDLYQIVDTFDRVPPEMMADLTEGLYSGGEARDNAYTAAMRMYRDFPNVMRSMPAEDLERLLLVDFAMTHLPEGESREALLITDDDPETVRRRRELYTSGLDLARDVDVDSVIGEFGSGFFGDLADMFLPGDKFPDPNPLGPYEMGRFEEQWQMLAATFYSRHGNWDRAQKDAVEMMQQAWGVTRVGSEAYLAEYPVEKSYDALNGSHEWATQQVEAMALSIDPNAQGWGLLKLPQTGQVVRHNQVAATNGTLRKEPVPYGLGIIDENGGFRPVLNDNGRLRAYHLDFDAALAAHRRMVDEEQAKVEMQRRATEDYLGPTGPTQGVQ